MLHIQLNARKSGLAFRELRCKVLGVELDRFDCFLTLRVDADILVDLTRLLVHEERYVGVGATQRVAMIHTNEEFGEHGLEFTDVSHL